MGVVPPRYLMTYLGAERPDCRALLRFPPGVTLEDAWRDFPRLRAPLPPAVVGHLRGLGVEVVAVGERPAFEALRRASAESAGARVGAFAEDYLGVNARLGRERCVTVEEYAMDTRVGGGEPLGVALMRHLRHMGGVRVYGGAAFREEDLPDALRLRVQDIALHEVRGRAPDSVPCLLHGGQCLGYRILDVADAIYAYLDVRHLGVRVAVPRSLLDEARDGGDPRQAAQALLGVVGCVFEALPRGAWDWRGGRLSRAVASLVALTVAETCEEHSMLVEALEGCRSLRGMKRRARDASRDASWVVSRTLERLRDRW